MKKALVVVPFLMGGCVSTKTHRIQLDSAYKQGYADRSERCDGEVAALQGQVEDYKRVYRIWSKGLAKAGKEAAGK